LNILNVGTWRSKCESCGKECSPHEKYHETNLGYAKNIPQPGCGVEFTHITTDYTNLGKIVAKMRPDLIFIDRFVGTAFEQGGD
jgi:hypothetical protein